MDGRCQVGATPRTRGAALLLELWVTSVVRVTLGGRSRLSACALRTLTHPLGERHRAAMVRRAVRRAVRWSAVHKRPSHLLRPRHAPSRTPSSPPAALTVSRVAVRCRGTHTNAHKRARAHIDHIRAHTPRAPSRRGRAGPRGARYTAARRPSRGRGRAQRGRRGRPRLICRPRPPGLVLISPKCGYTLLKKQPLYQ